jgi:hypothetical protein
MANKLNTLLLILFSLNFSFMRAAGNTFNTQSGITQEECNAPAPDSLHVEDANEDYIRLAWIPAWPGATHTLEVLQETSSGGWASLFTVYNVTGSSYDVFGLNHVGTKYRFVMATNCQDTGDPSVITTHIDWIGLILDLIMDGRTPVNPQVVPECTSVNYDEHEWVGFQIKALNTSLQLIYYFEFEEGADNGLPIPVIKRCAISPELVAADFTPKYPRLPDPLQVRIEYRHEFQVLKVKGEPIPYHFGNVLVSFNPFQKTVSICKNNFEYWDNNYAFSMLTATNTINTQNSSDIETLTEDGSLDIMAQSEFEKKLSEFENGGTTLLKVFTSTGVLILSKTLEGNYFYDIEEYSEIPFGMYFVTIQNGRNVFFKKMMKLN